MFVLTSRAKSDNLYQIRSTFLSKAKLSRVNSPMVFTGQSTFHLVGELHHELDSEGRRLREWVGGKSYHGETVEFLSGESMGRFNIVFCGNDRQATRTPCQQLLMEPCKSR